MNRYNFHVIRGTGYPAILTMNGDTVQDANNRLMEAYPDILEVNKVVQVG